MAADPPPKKHSPRGPLIAIASLVVFLSLLLMGYFILEPFRPTVQADFSDPATISVEIAVLLLQTGDEQERRSALMQLVHVGAEKPLAECLASNDSTVVQLATSGLWECWLNEAGNDARETMEAGVLAMNDGALDEAASIFRKLMARYPHWAEAANKMATVLYLQGMPKESSVLCRQVVALKPDHFGAWNGLALCAIQVEDWPLALQAVEQSLRLQPNSVSNRQLLRLVKSRITQV